MQLIPSPKYRTMRAEDPVHCKLLTCRPGAKFHHYKPQIALISGIAWDHINVFKTQADYNRQFEIFIESITAGGVLVFNELDQTLGKMVAQTQNTNL